MTECPQALRMRGLKTVSPVVTERERVALRHSANLHDEAGILGLHFDLVSGHLSSLTPGAFAWSSDMPSSAMSRGRADSARRPVLPHIVAADPADDR